MALKHDSTEKEEWKMERVYIDFIDQNKACPKDPFPLPRIDQLVDLASGHVMSLNNKWYFVVHVRGCQSLGSLCFQ